MFGTNRETMILAALVVALATCFYLFNEHKKTKSDIETFKTFMNKPQPQQPQVKPIVKKVEFVEPEPESEE